MGVKFDKILGKMRDGDEPTPGKLQTGTYSGDLPTSADVAGWPNGVAGIVSGAAMYFVYKFNAQKILMVELS